MEKEQSKRCPFCNENMIYGPNKQTMSYKGKVTTFILYGWKCTMSDENCDIIEDENDHIRNQLYRDSAISRLKEYIE